jgi:simple sugar transport system ATP-binding protein
MQYQTTINMIGITKRFAGVLANDNVDFNLRSGEIHCILGENGAGKTTLMNILSGVHAADAGKILVRDQTAYLRSPLDALKLGMGMVHQHFALIPNLSVLENLILGFEGGFFLNLRKAEQKLNRLSETYGLSIEPHQQIEQLSVSERQRTEILKILFHGSDILILDEPTSTLSPGETDDLFQTLQSLKNNGKSVILITHKLREALAISDRITIMRSGKKVTELSTEKLLRMNDQMAAGKIFEFMFGDLPHSPTKAAYHQPAGQTMLEFKNVSALNRRGAIGLKSLSFAVRQGEIFGITGIDSEGLRLVAEVIGGQISIVSGEMLYKGQDITGLSIVERFERGISYITDDRINESAVLDMTLSENATLQNHYQRPFSRFGIINQHVVKAFAANMVQEFGIQTAGSQVPLSTLSGGNIQKFLIARALAAKPALIVCVRPTHGLDARTVRSIHNLLQEECRRGAAVLLITSDMDELFTCSDRIRVLFDGELSDTMNRDDANHENIGKLMIGIQR